MRRPKVLQVVRPVAGGMWQHVLTLVDGLATDYEIVACCQDDAGQRRELQERGIPVRVVPIPADIQPGADIRARRVLREVIAEEQPRIVHTHGFHAGVLAASLLGPTKLPAHVCTLHTMAVPPGAGGLKRFVYELLQLRLLRRTPRLIVVSEAVRDALPKSRRSGSVEVIPNGVDLDRIAPSISRTAALAELAVEDRDLIVGCVARLAPEKGVSDFLRMAALVVTRRPEALFVIVGDGALRGEMEALAGRLNVASRTRFLGRRVPATDYMQAFDVTVVPSISEGQSLVAIESMLLGTPVVATTAGGLAEVVGEYGSLVPVARPDLLAGAVLEALSGGSTHDMARRAKERAEKLFGADGMVERTKQVYEEAIHEVRG